MSHHQAALWLRRARQQGFAIGAFNAVNLETAQAIVQAAEAENAPVVLQISENAARYAGLKPLFALAKAVKEDAHVPVFLHFDHAESLASAFEAVALGFDSVMLEGTGEAATNFEQLRQLTNRTAELGIAVEAELEVVEKADRAEDVREDIAYLLEQAAEAGCASVAINIGSKHKQTRKSTPLDFTRLQAIASLTQLPLVLHGSSGVATRDLQQAVVQGISKVNIATDLMVVFTNAVRSQLEQPTMHDPRTYLGAARNTMRDRIRQHIRILGSSGVASK